MADTLCGLCLKKGKANKMLYSNKNKRYICPVCKTITMPMQQDDDYAYIDVTFIEYKGSGYKEYVPVEYLTPASDWVKCSERMPELGVPVLVIGGSTAWVDKAYDSDDGVSFYEDNYGRATHWMPLPAPPQD